ncbi:M1 family metallopeptidase [Catenulispora subtropica]|uniref:Peptidase M1 membrane alanine aminopeptidase domain-containing protein n=1 Tax=Catenulispora subtropica TaxID=450798 RepID=A0ABN2SYE3_9ACTN
MGHSWTGTEKMAFTNPGKVPITEFWIRLWGNGTAGCGGTPAERISALVGGQVAETRENCTAYRIVLDTALAPGARGEVSFTLSIDVPVQRDRFGINGVDTYLGNALAVLAVKDENGWELPPYVAFGESYYSLAADYDVTLDHPAALQVPSTGVVAGETAAGDRLVTHLTAARVRDFSWSAGAFHHDSTVTASGVTVDAYWPNSESDSNCRDLMRYAARALDYYSTRYGAYPYPRFTIVFDEFGAAFDGMEYPNYVLASAYQGAVAHEVAHQWWFGLVGDDQYRHPWLDEAFAEYSTEEFQGNATPVHNCDWIASDERMDVSMDVYEKAGDPFYHDAVYHEGTCMLYDLEHTIGRDGMDKLLRDLVSTYEYGVIRPGDVRTLAAAVSGKDLSAFWSRWRNTAA